MLEIPHLINYLDLISVFTYSRVSSQMEGTAQKMHISTQTCTFDPIDGA